MKKALITGVTGQDEDGAYLSELLLAKGYEVHGIKRRTSLFNTDLSNLKPLQLTFVSRIERNKGWREFIQVCSKIKSNSSINFKATIVGSRSESNKLRGALKELDLADLITIKTGLPQKEIAKVLKESDLFVFTSYRESESLGLVGLEAMACGIPVIGSNYAGIKEYVIHQENGFLFKSRNVAEIFNCILAYQNLETSEKLQMKRAARKTAIKFSSYKVNEELEKELKRAMNTYE